MRYVVTVSPEYHVEILRQIIDFNLTAKQVKDLCEGKDLQIDKDDPIEKLPSVALKMAKVTQALNTLTARDLAKALMLQEADPVIARARIQALRRLVEETERFLVSE